MVENYLSNHWLFEQNTGIRSGDTYRTKYMIFEQNTCSKKVLYWDKFEGECIWCIACVVIKSVCACVIFWRKSSIALLSQHFSIVFEKKIQYKYFLASNVSR